MRTDQKQIAAHELDAFLRGVPDEFVGWQLQLRNGSVATVRTVRRRALQTPGASTTLGWSLQFVADDGGRVTRAAEGSSAPAWIVEVEDHTVHEEVYDHAFEELTFVRRVEEPAARQSR